MAGCQLFNINYWIIGCRELLKSATVRAALLVVITLLLVEAHSPHVVRADHLMCEYKAEERTQTVWIDNDLTGTGVTRADVIAAFEPWNGLFMKYHGIPIFREFTGSPTQADIVVTKTGTERTWVNTPCAPGFIQRGNTNAVVRLGWRDAWRQRQLLYHELGHALGLADHGSVLQQDGGHIGFQICNNAYLGVMSYCTSYQTWFMDISLPGITFDGGMVQRYW